MPTLSRRAFVAATSTALVVPAAAPRRVAASTRERIDGGVADAFPSQEPDLVRQVVGRAHVDYDAVRTLVTTRPELAKSAWDWGFGDWESALGAASHMGRRDIAELLIEYGARPDLFTFAMLGQVDVVRAICEANPGIQRLHGPHGITLLQHARQGGDEAQSVVDYLETLGDADVGPPSVPLSKKDAQPYVGVYVPDGTPGAVFTIAYQARRNVLTFGRDDRTVRFLVHLGDHAFSPGGAASVRITFDVHDTTAAAMSITDGDLRVKATRRV